MIDKITIALDCMGGDKAPVSVIEGASIISREYDSQVFFLLYGDERKINKILLKHPELLRNSKVCHTEDFIAGDEKPTIALRTGKNSSMKLAIDAVKAKEADACISAGNTGALMVMSKLVLRPLSSIDRPALIQLMPNMLGGATAMLDMGANIECDSINLCQFALMGRAFVKAILGIKEPKIGILNVGSEEMKGNDSIKNASITLKSSILKDDYYGFIEGNDILKGIVDVVVTDGFTGNVALKSIEGASKLFMSILKDGFTHSFFSKAGYLLAKNGLQVAKSKMDSRAYNGALLIGLNGISVKSHGNADAYAFSMAIKNTISLVKGKIIKEICEYMKETNFDNSMES